jgi:hypothetical protein
MRGCSLTNASSHWLLRNRILYPRSLGASDGRRTWECRRRGSYRRRIDWRNNVRRHCCKQSEIERRDWLLSAAYQIQYNPSTGHGVLRAVPSGTPSPFDAGDHQPSNLKLQTSFPCADGLRHWAPSPQVCGPHKSRIQVRRYRLRGLRLCCRMRVGKGRRMFLRNLLLRLRNKTLLNLLLLEDPLKCD